MLPNPQSVILKKTTKPATHKTLKKINSDVHVYMSCQSNMLNKKDAITNAQCMTKLSTTQAVDTETNNMIHMGWTKVAYI